MKRLSWMLVAAVALLAAGCAGSVKKDDGSKVPWVAYRCADGHAFDLAMHNNRVYLKGAFGKTELKRLPMKDGMVRFGDGEREIAYEGRAAILTEKGLSHAECMETSAR